MVSHFNNAISVIITFFVTLALTSFVNYWSGDRGSIAVSRPVFIGDQAAIVVSIENYSKEFIDGLTIEVPRELRGNQIITDSPISISEEPTTSIGKTQFFLLEKIPPRVVSRVIIPIASKSESIRIANAETHSLRVLQEGRLESPWAAPLRAGFFTALIYSIFAYAISRIHSKTFSELREKQEELKLLDRESRKELEKTRGELKGQLNVIETRLAKQKTLLMARLTDYSRELEFWRNLIRKFVSESKNIQKGDDLVRLVTQTLKTHGATENYKDLEELKVLAGWMAEAERGSPKESSASKTD